MTELETLRVEREKAEAKHAAEDHAARLAAKAAELEDTKARTAATEAEMKRSNERTKAESAQSAETHERAMMLLGALVPVLEAMTAAGTAARIAYQYGDEAKIRANACELLVSAAGSDAKAKQAAAERLLEIAGVGKKPSLSAVS